MKTAPPPKNIVQMNYSRTASNYERVERWDNGVTGFLFHIQVVQFSTQTLQLITMTWLKNNLPEQELSPTIYRQLFAQLL